MRLPSILSRGSDAISPTAHYTGHVWVRNGLSHPELATWEGRLLFEAMQPSMIANRVVGGPTLEGSLLTRHGIIDHVLAGAIDDGRIGQVVEVACGMSPRGWRFAERYGERLAYVEADLPDMAARKRRALERIGSLGDHHRVVELDVLRDGGPGSLAALAGKLDPGVGTAIVTEGLLTYFSDDDVLGMWRRFTGVLRRFPHGLYASDLHLRSGDGPRERAFRALLATFVRGRVYNHFADEAEAIDALRGAGFDDARLHHGAGHPAAAGGGRDLGAARVLVIEASTG